MNSDFIKRNMQPYRCERGTCPVVHPILFIIALVLSTTYVNAQITFQKAYGGTGNEYGYSVQQTTDGGYIITGRTNSFGAGNTDVYLIKTNAYGDTSWTKTYGGTGPERGCSVQQTTDGGYVILGWIYGLGAGGYDVYLIKTNSNGDTLWTKTYGEISDDYAYSVQQTMDGGFIITATYNDQAWLIKTDLSGDTLWTKIFNDIVRGYSGRQTFDGGYIITGAVGTGICLHKTNANGDPLWTKQFGTGSEYGNSVQQTSDSGYVITGYTSSYSAGSADAYLIRTNSFGDTLWTKTYGGTGDDRGLSVQQTSDGGFIVAGFTSSFGAGNIYLIKTNAIGDTIWTKAFGGLGDEWAWSINQTTDGGYIILGWTNSFGTGGYDIYLIKTDSNGNSGCNQYNTATIVGSAPFQITTPPTQVSSGCIVTSPATIVNNGGIVTDICLTTSIKEITKDAVSIYPNPANTALNIHSPLSMVNFQLSIENVFGQKIYQQTLSTIDTKINVSKWSKGIYFYEIISEKETWRGKFIVN